MQDIIEASIREIQQLALSSFRERARPLTHYAIEPGSEFGMTPDGHHEAFRAGARPPFPGPRAAPDLVARWNALGRSARSGRIVPRAETDHRLRSQVPRSSNSGGGGIGASVWESSTNWSGAMLTAREDERFSAVSARWRVPDARPSETAPPPIPGPDGAEPSRRCSVWIGLDGHRLASRSLPQIGTTTAEVFGAGGRRVETYAWAQWWVRGEQYGEMVFEDFAVAPGDEVTCWLALHEPGRAVFRISNETTGAEDGVVWRSGTTNDRLAFQIHREEAPVPGQAAVWIVERPMVMGRTELYPLPDFGEVRFGDCIAAVRGARQPFHEAADLRDLRSRRFIRMFDQPKGPWRARHIAGPEPTGPDRLGLTVRRCG